jgi:hypothetical protein
MPFLFLKLFRCVLNQKLIDRNIATTDPHFQPLLLDSQSNLPRPKTVNTRLDPQEHNLQLSPIWVIVNVLCQSTIE